MKLRLMTNPGTPESQEVPIRKILVPILDSSSLETFQHAIKIARVYHAQLTALYVVEVPSSLPLGRFLPENVIAAENVLERTQWVARQLGIPKIQTNVVQSREAGAAIIETAHDGNFDLIVMEIESRKGHVMRGLGRAVNYVLRNASCRVWLMMA